jgi:hypothetical protein
MCSVLDFSLPSIHLVVVLTQGRAVDQLGRVVQTDVTATRELRANVAPKVKVLLYRSTLIIRFRLCLYFFVCVFGICLELRIPFCPLSCFLIFIRVLPLPPPYFH